MINRINSFFFSSQIEFRFRIFRLILVMGTILSLLGAIEGLYVGIDILPIIFNLILFISMVAGMIFMFYYHKPDWAVFLVGFMMVTVGFPPVFLTGGGVDGGASIWFVIGIIYPFIMYSGKKMVLFVSYAISIDLLTYVLAFHFPEFMSRGISREIAYADSVFSVVVVGVTVGIVLKYQTRQYEKERELAIAQKEGLEKLEQSRNQFFASMSHEIRTPIYSIVGHNELNLRWELPEEVMDNALVIDDSGKMLLSLVNDILDMAQLEMGNLKIIPVEYNTKELFNDLIHMMQPSIKEKELDFFVNIDGNLPTVMLGDANRIKQIVLNLLINAVKYTSSGSIVLSAHGDFIGEEWVKLTVVVSDTGTGIRKEDMSSLFMGFYRVNDKENSTVEGAGLGLTICKKLLDLMGGEITVDSTYTKGSDFTIILEQRIIDITPMGAINHVVAHRGADRKRYKQSFEAPEARVLIVDDNSMNLKVAAKLLSPTKVQIDTAQSGEACLQMTKRKNYQVILMDHMMPNMDGVETLNAIRRQKNGLCRETPVLALTANADFDSEEKYHEYGFQSYLCKPISGEILEREVLRFLPDILVEYQASKPNIRDMVSTSGRYIDKISGRKRKKICITTDCVCDLSSELVQALDVKMMYLYITTKNARFRDTIEITSDNMSQYMEQIGNEFYADSASVEEFEEFFAQALSESEEIIHISLASRTGVSYGIARQAARGFGHVHVINSGQISGGEALLVLQAVKMVKEDKGVFEIYRELEAISKKIHTTFLLPSANIFCQRGYMKSKRTARLCDALFLHPVLHMKGSSLKVCGFLWGRQERAWKSLIHMLLLPRKRICTDVVFITHVGLSIRQLEMIKKEILDRVSFREVRIEKASVSNACNSGLKSLGISFFYK